MSCLAVARVVRAWPSSRASAVAGRVAGCTTSDDSCTGAKGYITGEGVVTTIDAGRPARACHDSQGDSSAVAVIDTADYAGKVMVLNIWASWCRPCRAEADDLVETAEAVSRRRLRRAQRPRQRVRLPKPSYVTKDVPYPSLVSEDGSVLLEFYGLLNVNSLPSTIVVDSDGKVAALVLGEVTAGTLVGTHRRRAEGSLRPVPTMYVAAIGDWFRDTAFDGSLLLAVPVAFIAGLVSFFSPCVLPLLPGYLSYMTGLVGRRHRRQRQHRRARPDGDRARCCSSSASRSCSSRSAERSVGSAISCSTHQDDR